MSLGFVWMEQKGQTEQMAAVRLACLVGGFVLILYFFSPKNRFESVFQEPGRVFNSAVTSAGKDGTAGW